MALVQFEAESGMGGYVDRVGGYGSGTVLAGLAAKYPNGDGPVIAGVPGAWLDRGGKSNRDIPGSGDVGGI